MVGRLLTATLLALLISQLALAQPLSHAPAAPLTVVWCDRAGVSKADRIQERAQVDYIVKSAGIQLLWVENDTCIGLKLDSYFIIITVPRRPEDIPASSDAMGRALVESAHPRAYIFLDKVQEFDWANRAVNMSDNRGVLLGHAMAHELGHLLGLPHTPAGIMRSHWGHEEWTFALAGTLVFSRAEMKRVKHSD